MLVLTRLQIPTGAQDVVRAGAGDLLHLLSGLTGFVRGHLGQAPDDPQLWVLATEWEGVGAYRRALSSYDVKVTAVPLLSQALDEPSAYETDRPGTPTNEQRPRDLR